MERREFPSGKSDKVAEECGLLLGTDDTLGGST